MRIIFVFLALMAALRAVAQPSEEIWGRNHTFPLFVDGGGFQTHLFVTNVSDAANQCTLMLQGAGFQSDRLQPHGAVTAAGSAATIDLSGAGVSLALVSAGTQAFASAYATLACGERVIARALLTSSVSSSLVAMTALESAQAADSFQFPALPRLGSLLMTVSNDSDSAAACSVELEDRAGASVGGGSFTVPGKSAVTEILGSLIAIPDEFEGGTATASCDREVAALGLLQSGTVFTALPAFDPNGDGALKSSHIFPLVADGDGFRSLLLVTNLSAVANQCILDLHGPGLNADRFEARSGITAAGSQVRLDFSGAGEQLELTSKDEQSLAFGHATLACDQPVAALDLLMAGAQGELTGMATLPSAQLADRFQFPVVSRAFSLALVLANNSASSASCAFDLRNEAGATASSNTIKISARSTAVRFLDDLFTVPDSFSGGIVDVSCDADLAPISLPLSGGVFTAFPAAGFSSSATTDVSPVFAAVRKRITLICCKRSIIFVVGESCNQRECGFYQSAGPS